MLTAHGQSIQIHLYLYLQRIADPAHGLLFLCLFVFFRLFSFSCRMRQTNMKLILKPCDFTIQVRVFRYILQPCSVCTPSANIIIHCQSELLTDVWSFCMYSVPNQSIESYHKPDNNSNIFTIKIHGGIYLFISFKASSPQCGSIN